MKKKRMLALLLASAVIGQLFTGVVFADDTLTYIRKKPETAILNAYNGNSSNFYDSIISDSSQYNAIGLFGLSHSGHISSGSYSLANYQGSVLSEVGASYGNLRANISGTFHNNWHKHGAGFLGLQKQKVLAYSGMTLSNSGSFIKAFYGSNKSSETDARLGNTVFESFPNYTSNDLSISFTGSSVKYDNGKKTCTCGGSYVTKTVAAFKDENAPKISQVGGNIKTQNVFKSGDTIEIEMKYNEPIRLADDNPSGKNLYLRLDINGKTEDKWPQAALTKLENDTLFFSYKVPSDVGNQTINRLDLSPLMGKDIKLVQVKGDKSFNISIPKDASGKSTGYTTTTAYITDLAGNAINTSEVTLSAYMDSETPFVASVNASVNANNQTVKNALDKTDVNASDYLDNSDLYLGNGDTISFKIYINEILSAHTDLWSNKKYTALEAVTNLTKNGQPVKIKSCYLFNSAAAGGQYGLGASRGKTATFLTDALKISDDLVCSDADGVIRIKEINLTDNNVTDLAGNKASKMSVNDSMFVNKYYLDTDKPKITTSAEKSGEKYNVAYENGTGFRFGFTISDKSGTNGLRSRFAWSQSDLYLPYEYTVTLSPTLSGNEEWTKSSLGCSSFFNQVEGEQFIHIRQVSGETYSISETTLSVYAVDYSGNGDLYSDDSKASFPLNMFWDTVAPKTLSGNVSRGMNNDGSGTITINASLSDETALDKAFYIFGGETEPTKDDSAWLPALGTIEGEKNADISVSATAAQNEYFKKHLWIKASDSAGNVSVTDLGVFEYNLSAIAYTLDYSSAIANKAVLKATSIENGGVLVFMIPTETAGEYFVRTFSSEVAALGGDAQNAFRDWASSVYNQGGFESLWTRMEVSEAGGKYTFTPSENADRAYLDNIIDRFYAAFSGTLPVTVISGVRGAFTLDSSYAPLSAGNDSYNVATENVALRISSDSQNAADAFSEMSFTTDCSYINNELKHYPWFRSEDGAILSTPVGLSFEINLGTDVNGWNYEDINFENTFVEFYNSGTAVNTKFPIKKAPVQTFTVPEGSYESGRYFVGLRVDCYSGKNYTVSLSKDGSDTNMFIDAAESSKDFGITSVTYTPEVDRWYDYDGKTVECMTDDEIIYLPVQNGKNQLTVTVNDIVPTKNGWLGAYNTAVWNETAGVDSTTARKNTLYNMDYMDSPLVYDVTAVNSAEDITYDGTLQLVKNQINVLGVQVVHANGNKSEIKYYRIYPTESIVNGSFTSTLDDNGGDIVEKGDVIFTPADGISMDGVTLYCSGYVQSAGAYSKSAEMTPQSDGTYTSPLLADAHYYRVYAVDKYLNFSTVKNTSDGEEDYYLSSVDDSAPIVTQKSVSSSDGSFETEFRIDDETLNSRTAGYNYVYNPINLSFYYNSEYAERLGSADGTRFDITLENEDINYFVWNAKQSNDLGIYSITSSRTVDNNKYYIDIKVKGAVSYADDGSSDVSFTLNMDAKDKFGHIGTGKADVTGAENVKPHIIASGEKAPVYKQIGNGFDMALYLNFNVPVLPTESWICPEPDTYSSEQHDAFPITNDGISKISYYDIFGKLQTEEISIDNVFGIYGLDIDFSTLELTGESIDFSAKTAESDTDGMLLLWEKTYDNRITTVWSPDYTHNIPLKEKKATIDDNKVIMVARYDREYSNDELFNKGKYTFADFLTINITNIGKEAPVAEPRFYFEQTGREYTIDTVPQGETTGNVKVWYKTSRNVTATNNSGDEYIFKAGGTTSHTFTYVDDLKNEGSLDIDLNSLGVILKTPPAPPKDEDKPIVSAELYAKRYQVYSAADSIGDGSVKSNITEAFERTNYVQGYSMKVKVNDSSSYKIVLKNAAPTALSYTTAASDSIDGISISGNTIKIDKPADFTVAIVDNASGESAATADNYTYFTISKEDMEKWFDNTNPTAQTKEIATSLYEKSVYIKLSDKSDDNTDTSSYATMIMPKLTKISGGEYDGWYMQKFTDNESMHFEFEDIAGNTGKSDAAVSGIDTSKPTLKTTWSPCYVSGEPAAADESAPPTGPVNTAVTANITSSASIKSVTAEYSYDNESWDTNPISGVEFSYSDEMITVRFKESAIGIRLSVASPNGKSTVGTLYLADGVIDTSAPNIYRSVEYLKRDGAAAPYAARITYKPIGESVLGTNGAEYSNTAPFTETVRENGKITHTFTDKAGNTAGFVDEYGMPIENVLEISGIDNKKPILTTTPEDTLSLPFTSGKADITVSADEKCAISCNGSSYQLNANEGKTLSFSQNGVYSVTATDSAGNAEEKVIVVGNIDKIPPILAFDKLTLSARQDCEESILRAFLDSGVTVTDNTKNSAPTFSYDISAVNTAKVGIYTVPYTAVDSAGNEGVANRFVKITDKNMPEVRIDGELTEENGTLPVTIGEHVLTACNLAEISDGINEPYTVKIRKGICTAAQMKYFASTVIIDKDGKFKIGSNGFYTLYITTQSRQSYRAVLYAEKQEGIK